ncbi:MAG: hypothetical protein QM644_03430 [Mobilitalea sp.]
MKKNILTTIGILIFIVTYMINRFVLEISDPVYIIILLVAVTAIIIGMIKIRHSNNEM